MAQRILELIRTQGPISRAEIARRADVSKPTVSSIVQHLVNINLLAECGLAQSAGGRRAMLLEFNAEAGFVIGMDIGGTTARAAIANLAGEILAVMRQPTMKASEAGLVAQLRELKSRLAADIDIDESKIVAAAIGTPGVIDANSRSVHYAPNLAVLEAPGFVERLEEALGIPTSLHNDVNLAALGEKWRGMGRGVSDFIFVTIGTGLGFGLILQGRLYQGSLGRAGEFSYAPFSAGAATTLEDMISGPAIARHHHGAGGSGSTEDAFNEAESGLEPGFSVINSFIERLAWMLCALSTLLDPKRVILGGGIGMRCARHLACLQDSLARQSPILPEIMISQLGNSAGLHGALATALEKSEPLLMRAMGGERVKL
jgi:predicted NBD/HSP70 family sugar kinase